MYNCRVLDAMRSCYQYSGEYAVPPSTTPTPGIVRYYFICVPQPSQFLVPYGSHFYDQPSHKIGHLVKPPGYAVTDGSSPFLFSECRCCFDSKPIIASCPCPFDVAGLFVQVNYSPWGGYNTVVSGTWQKTLGEYSGFDGLFPDDSGYSIEAITANEDSRSWDVHFSTPTGYVTVNLPEKIPPGCEWAVNSGGDLSPEVQLGALAWFPCGG